MQVISKRHFHFTEFSNTDYGKLVDEARILPSPSPQHLDEKWRKNRLFELAVSDGNLKEIKAI